MTERVRGDHKNQILDTNVQPMEYVTKAVNAPEVGNVQPIQFYFRYQEAAIAYDMRIETVRYLVREYRMTRIRNPGNRKEPLIGQSDIESLLKKLGYKYDNIYKRLF